MRGYTLIGAHRTGKTSIAQEVSRNLSIEFVPSFTSTLFKEIGFDPRQSWGASKRLEVQKLVLERHIASWKSYMGSGNPWITDRSPIDFIVYTMNDAITWDDSSYEDYIGYLSDCIEAHKEFFSLSLLIQPDGVIEEGDAPYKGRASRVLQDCMNTSYKGILSSSLTDGEDFYIVKDSSRLGKRLEVFGKVFDRLCREVL